MEPCTHYLYIEDDEIDYIVWIKALSPLYTRHKLVVLNNASAPELLPFQNDPDIASSTAGWVTQQLIKFKMARIIKSSRYLILDSKNLLVKTIFVCDSFNFSGSGKLTPHHDSCFNQWQPWINYCSEQLNKPIPPDFWWPQTPFILEKGIVTENMDSIENLFYNFLLLKDSNRLPSEFIAYRFIMDPEINDPQIHTHSFIYSDTCDLDDLIKSTASAPWFTIYRHNLRDHDKKLLLLDFLNFMGLDAEFTKPALFLTDVRQ
jgi:hypothetical protein